MDVLHQCMIFEIFDRAQSSADLSHEQTTIHFNICMRRFLLVLKIIQVVRMPGS